TKERARARNDEPSVRPRARNLTPHVEQEEQVLPLLEPAEKERHDLAAQTVPRDQRRRLGRVTEASVDTVRDHRKLLARHSQLSRGLPRREFTTDHDPLDRAHHTPLDQPIETVPVT